MSILNTIYNFLREYRILSRFCELIPLPYFQQLAKKCKMSNAGCKQCCPDK